MAFRRLVFRVHAIRRMFEYRFTERDIHESLASAEIIEEYPHDKPYPSQLALGWLGIRPIHLVVAQNEKDEETIVITVYEPDPKRWDADFKRRKKR